MQYEIETTNIFDKWFSGIKNAQYKARIISRFDRVQMGNFGDNKSLGKNLFELRFVFGPGHRIYYTIKNAKIIFLVCGGDKSSQVKDITKAKLIMEKLP
jgi:putative addiction module killer protein